MKKFAATVLLAVATVLGFGLVLELLFRALPVSSATETDYILDPVILSYPPRHEWVASSGWDLRHPQHLQANNVGFVSEHDFVPDPQALALVGDSYVEASMLAADQRPGAQLERALGASRKVYSLGGPGSSLLDYAERVRYAYQQLGVRDFVIEMERGDVRQALCGSGNNHGPCLDAQTLAPRIQTLPPPSESKRVLRHSALAQYVVGQLKVDFGQLASDIFKRDVPALAHEGGPKKVEDASPAAAAGAAEPKRALSPAGRQRVEAVTDAFWQRVAATAPQARIVFVVDGGRTRRTGPPSDIDLESQYFVEIARARGYTVVDGEQVFAEHMATSPLSLSVSPQDGHMNGYAVGLLMRATAQALR